MLHRESNAMTFLHQLFELRKRGPERCDCTAPYDVIFRFPNRHPTVNQFLNSVISHKNDWGKVHISPGSAYTTVWDLMGYHGKIDSLEYRWGEWVKNYDIFVEKYGNRKIKSATADGGWSLMDYTLLLEDDDMKYEEFGDIDIPADFEFSIKDGRSCIERMHEEKLLTTSEYNSIMTIIDGAEARKYKSIKALNNG